MGTQGRLREKRTNMKRATLLTVVMALVVALSASAAMAAVLEGNNQDNTIRGTADDDIIYGNGGDDELFGGDGDDRVFGGDGNDYLSGSFGVDFLRGNDGNDTILGGPQADRAEGSTGTDSLSLAGDGGNDEAFCGEDSSNTDRDVARVDSNDAVDGVLANTLVSSAVTSCEIIFVNGTRLPGV